MEYDGAEVEVKVQKISSICLGISSDDIAGEVNAEECEAELKDMAVMYEDAIKLNQ